MILVSIDTGERVDDAESDESEDEEWAEQRGSTEVDHVIDVEGSETGSVGRDDGVEGWEGEPCVTEFIGSSVVAGKMWRWGW